MSHSRPINKKENWVELLCQFCHRTTGAMVNTKSKLGGQFVGTCPKCLSGSTPMDAVDKWAMLDALSDAVRGRMIDQGMADAIGDIIMAHSNRKAIK